MLTIRKKYVNQDKLITLESLVTKNYLIIKIEN